MAGIKARHKVPPPNPNPRPPNEPRPVTRVSGAQIKAVPGNALKNYHLASQGGSQRQGQQQKAAAAPAQAQGGGPAFAPPVDPRDAQYWQDQATLTFNRNNILSRLGLEDKFAKTNYDRELNQLKYLAPREVQNLREGANAEGAIYSTVTQERLGDLGQEQFNRQSGLSSAYQQALSERALSRGEAEGSYNLGIAQSGIDATGRAAAKELERPGPIVSEPVNNYTVINKRLGNKPRKQKKR